MSIKASLLRLELLGRLLVSTPVWLDKSLSRKVVLDAFVLLAFLCVAFVSHEITCAMLGFTFFTGQALNFSSTLNCQSHLPETGSTFQHS